MRPCRPSLACALVLLAACHGGARLPAADRPLDETPRLRAELLASGAGRHEQGAAIASLEKLGSPQAVAALRDFLTSDLANRRCKGEALAALGRIGSKESVAAIGDFERWTRARSENPPPFRFGLMESPIWHMAGQELAPAAEARDAQRRTWAVFWWRREGRRRLWLARQIDGRAGTWTEPRVTPVLPSDREPARSGVERFTVEGDTFSMTVGGREAEFSLSDTHPAVLPQHGLKKIEPKVLKAPPESAPREEKHPPSRPALDPAGDEVQIRQAVFTMFFATCNGRETLLLVRPNARTRAKGEAWLAGKEPAPAPEREPEKVREPADDRQAAPVRPPDFTDHEYFGYAGPLQRVDNIIDGASNLTNIAVKIASPTTATAYIEDWVGNLAASGTVVELRKVHGKWVVVALRERWIS